MSKKENAPEKNPTKQEGEDNVVVENEDSKTAENSEKGAEKKKKSRKKKGKEGKLMEELEEAQLEILTGPRKMRKMSKARSLLAKESCWFTTNYTIRSSKKALNRWKALAKPLILNYMRRSLRFPHQAKK